MNLAFLKGQLVAYNEAIEIIGNGSEACYDMRDELAQSIIDVLISMSITYDCCFSKYLVELIPKQISTVVQEISNGMQYKLTEDDLTIITNYLSRHLSDENKEAIDKMRLDLLTKINSCYGIANIILDLEDAIIRMKN